MERLEDVLSHVESLKDDLTANIQDEKGRWEEVITGGSRGGNCYSGEDVYFINQEAIPNTEKREAARKELQKLYDSSEWYSARYNAGKSLELDVDSQLESWIDNLRKNLHAQIYLEPKQGG